MESNLALAPCVVLPTSQPPLVVFGDEVTFHLTGEQTGGRFTMFTLVTPPGNGPPIHYHENEDEWFYPLDGRVEFYQDGRWAEVPIGSAVFMPRRVVHAFRNAGDTPLRMLIHTAPAGFERFFARCAEVFAGLGELDMQRIIDISAEHGIHYPKA